MPTKTNLSSHPLTNLPAAVRIRKHLLKLMKEAPAYGQRPLTLVKKGYPWLVDLRILVSEDPKSQKWKRAARRFIRPLRSRFRYPAYEELHDRAERWGKSLEQLADEMLMGGLVLALGPPDRTPELRRGRTRRYYGPEGVIRLRLRELPVLNRLFLHRQLQLDTVRAAHAIILNKQYPEPSGGTSLDAERRRQLASLAPMGRVPGPDEALAEAKWRQMARQVLTPAQWEVVDRRLKGYTTPEIAHARGCSESTVRVHLHDARERLRRAGLDRPE